MAPVSGIGRRAILGASRWPCTREVKGGRYVCAPGGPSAVSLLGRICHWSRDRGCEPAQLTERQATVRARMEEIGRDCSAYRAQKPRHGRPWRGFAMTEPITVGSLCVTTTRSLCAESPAQSEQWWLDWPPSDHLWIGRNRGNSCPSQRATNAPRKHPCWTSWH
jgi:hypothetical protein